MTRVWPSSGRTAMARMPCSWPGSGAAEGLFPAQLGVADVGGLALRVAVPVPVAGVGDPGLPGHRVGLIHVAAARSSAALTLATTAATKPSSQLRRQARTLLTRAGTGAAVRPLAICSSS